LLVISHACFMAINRKVYQLLLREGWELELVVPETMNFPTGALAAQPPAAGDPPIHYLPLKGDNPRTYYYEGLTALLEQKRPALVLLDNDPVSRMAGETGSWCRSHQSALFCISCENLPLDIMDAIRRRGVKNLPAAILKRWMLRRNRAYVDGVFCINNDGKRIFEAEGFRQVSHMPLGYDPAVFFPNETAGKVIRQRHGFNTKVIAYFGRLTPEKGIHILISALGQLKDRQWQLMMDHFDEYASPYHKEIKQAISEAGITDRVVFVNPDHVEIADYMNAADIIVVPSLSVPNWKEQYGRVAAEGMACGRTVIASGSGALPELLGGHGLLFREGDVKALAALLDQCLTGPPPEMPDSARIARYAQEKLSIYQQAKVLERAFESFGLSGQPVLS